MGAFPSGHTKNNFNFKPRNLNFENEIIKRESSQTHSRGSSQCSQDRHFIAVRSPRK